MIWKIVYLLFMAGNAFVAYMLLAILGKIVIDAVHEIQGLCKSDNW